MGRLCSTLGDISMHSRIFRLSTVANVFTSWLLLLLLLLLLLFFVEFVSFQLSIYRGKQNRARTSSSLPLLGDSWNLSKVHQRLAGAWDTSQPAIVYYSGFAAFSHRSELKISGKHHAFC
jgi:uncharacterized membrane protein